jgi:hypothetical protein
MGTDTYAYSGVVVNYAEVVDMLCRLLPSMSGVRDELLEDADFCSELAEIKAWVRQEDLPTEADNSQQGFNEIGSALTLLKEVKANWQFCAWFKNLCGFVVRGEVAKYGNCWVENEDLVTTIVDTITKQASLQFPSYELEAFGSYRLTGFEGELGELQFNFSVEGCFERRLTEEGRMLAKALGNEELYVSEWAVTSS